MKYFESHLTSLTNEDEVDISVHCDIGVFEWLAQYMEDTKKAECLDANSVVSILISSEFLQIHSLVDECLRYLVANLNKVIRLPIDLSCLSSDIVRRLSEKFVDEDLEGLRDRRGRLQGRLFAHKLQELLGEDDNALYACTLCRALYTAKHKSLLRCPEASAHIDFHGNVIAHHVPRTDWDVSNYVQYCHETLRLPWRDIYWKLWGRIQTLKCTTCNVYFSGAEIGHCTHHLAEPVWETGAQSHMGHYPCCQRSVVRFGTVTQRSGCAAREHVPYVPEHESTAEGGAGATAALIAKLRRFQHVACVPYVPPDNKPTKVSPEEPKTVENSGSDGRGSEEDDQQSTSNSECHFGLAHFTNHAGYCFGPLPEHMPPAHSSTAPGSNRQNVTTSPETKRPPSTKTQRVRKADPRLNKLRPSQGAAYTPIDRRASPSSGGGAQPRKGGWQETNASVAGPSVGCAPVLRPVVAGEVVPSNAGGFWTVPPPKDERTFFSLGLPNSMPPARQLDWQLDMLREDDRRRMDELGNHLNRYRNSVEKEHGNSWFASGAAQRRSLSWVGEAAAVASVSTSSCELKEAEPPPQPAAPLYRQSGSRGIPLPSQAQTPSVAAATLAASSAARGRQLQNQRRKTLGSTDIPGMAQHVTANTPSSVRSRPSSAVGCPGGCGSRRQGAPRSSSASSKPGHGTPLTASRPICR